jgi:hypothetical protein
MANLTEEFQETINLIEKTGTPPEIKQVIVLNTSQMISLILN